MNKSFLSKKSFHPGKLCNQKKVWEAEQDKIDEERKIEILKRERIEEHERELEERKLAQDNGTKYVEKLNWMYDAPMGSVVEQKPISLTIESCGRKKSSGLDVRDLNKKIGNDPLLKTKQKENSLIQEIMKNPVKVRQIEEKEITKLVRRWNEEKRERSSIQHKIWITSEKGKVGDAIIRKEPILWDWWREMIRNERISIRKEQEARNALK
ncbi:CBF1-interacting co-repressor CIR N-terminal domain-containing protein [Entamoeba marina]